MTEAPAQREKTRARRVFIVGCRRSGTTWTAMLLAQHPNVVAVQQSGFFLSLEQLIDWIENRRKYGRAVLTSGGDSEELERRHVGEVFSPERFHELIRPLADEVYDHVADWGEGTLAVVDQQPEHVRLWRHIDAIVPDALYLHVIRDPRAVFSSYYHSARSWSSRDTFTADPLEFGDEWNEAVRQGREIGSAAGERYVEVRYEQLKKDGAGELQRIYRALGLQTDAARAQAAIDACSIDKLRKSAHGPAAFFRKGEAAGWRSELSGRNLQAVEYVCAELMDELGYERVHRDFTTKPVLVRKRDRRARTLSAARGWIRGEGGWVKKTVRGVVRKVPGLHKLAYRVLKW